MWFLRSPVERIAPCSRLPPHGQRAVSSAARYSLEAFRAAPRVDAPSGRKIHSTPVPLLGGAAIYVSFVLVLIFFGDRFYINQFVGIFAGASFMSLMGVLDDRWGLGSYVKLAGQLLAAAILVFSGVQVQLFGLFGLPVQP